MPLTPTGLFNAPVVYLMDYLAHCATFQALVIDAAGLEEMSAAEVVTASGLTPEEAVAAAAARIFPYSVEGEDIPESGTYIECDHAGQWGRSRAEWKNQFTAKRGSLFADIQIAVPEAYRNATDAHVYFGNLLGAILLELEEYAQDHHSIVVYGWQVQMGPARASKEERVRLDYVGALIEVEAS